MSIAGSGLGRRFVVAALLLVVSPVAVACGDAEPSDDSIRGLAILSGDVGRTRLTVHAAADGAASDVDVPDPATAWISGAPGGVLVATMADGRLAIRDVDGLGATGAWRLVEPASDGQSIGSVLFGAASPDGARVAALALGAAGQFGLAVTEAETGDAVVFPIEDEPILTSPAWIDGERIGVVVADAELAGAVTLADVGSGDLTGGPGNVRAVAMSGDGAVAVYVSTTDGRLYGSNAASWLAGQEIAALPIEAPSSDAVPGSFALDARGERLAVVWEAPDGSVVTIAVHARTSDGWSVAGRLDPPAGDPRAVVTWLR